MERYQNTLASLRQMIGSWAQQSDGRVPPERVLAEQLGTGRRVLRRALAELEEEGVVQRHQGRGTFVVDKAAPAPRRGEVPVQDDWRWLAQRANPVEMIELRLIIEPIMARRAALYASQQDVQRLRRLAQRTRDAAEHTAYQAADTALHRFIAELSHNALFLMFFDAFSGALREEAMARFGESGHCFKRQSAHAAFHEAIVAAIAARDGARAEQLMHEHLSDVHQSLFADALPTGYRARRESIAAE
ncbi:MAG: FCD domain-containing protein [Alphaproteobacteria bacterium]